MGVVEGEIIGLGCSLDWGGVRLSFDCHLIAQCHIMQRTTQGWYKEALLLSPALTYVPISKSFNAPEPPFANHEEWG